MRFLRQSTQVLVRIGPFVDVGDGFTPETGITLGAADEAELLKDTGGVVDISAATWAAIATADGYYNLTLTTSHTDTLGQLTIVVQDDSVCLPVVAYFMVLPPHVYDSMFGDASGEAGTAQAGAAGTITLRAGASATDDLHNNKIVRLVGGTGAGQSRYIHDYVGATKVASVSPNWATNPDATTLYIVDQAPPAPTNSAVLPTVMLGADAVTAAAIAADAATELNTAVLARLPAALVGGRMDARIGAVGSHALTGTGPYGI